MPHMITLPDEVFTRLQAHAVPLVDTPVSVIERAIAALEAGDEATTRANHDGPRSFNPAAAPNLSHTTPRKAVLGGRTLPASATYWNPIMHAVIEEAARRGVGSADLLELMTINCVAGEKTADGYKYLPGAGLSVQGQAANAAWRQAYRVASSVGIGLEVQFVWQDNDKAAMPNTLGSFFVEGK